MKSLSVSLLFVFVSGLAGDRGGPFFSFQGIQPVQSFDNKGFKAGIFYPISSFSNQFQYAPQQLTNQRPEIDQSADQKQFLPTNQLPEIRPSTNQRQSLPTNQNLEFDPSTNEIDIGPTNQKLQFDHHPEELLSMKLIEKIKSQQRIPEKNVSPFLKRKMEELSFRKKTELNKLLRTNQLPTFSPVANENQAFSPAANENQAFSPAANENQAFSPASNRRQFLVANQGTVPLTNENKVPELKVNFNSGRYYFSYSS